MARERDRGEASRVEPAHPPLGRRLRALRIQKGLTQGDVERRTGLLRGHVSRLENGHIAPSLDTLQRYADALEIPLYLIFYQEPSQAAASREIPEAAIEAILEEGGDKVSLSEATFFRKLKKISASLSDADREFLLAMAEKMAGLGKEEKHSTE
jgi:transcriptional regulator with XRE-family HTH domain